MQPNPEEISIRVRGLAPSTEGMHRSNFVGQWGQRKGKTVNETTVKIKKDELLRLLLSGHTVREAAVVLRVSPPTLRKYIREEGFQQELKSLSMEIWSQVDEEMSKSKMSMNQRIQQMSETALERISELMDSEDERVVLHASNSVLDRNPETSKHHKVENTDIKIILDPAQLALAAQTAQEINRTIEGQP